VKEAAGRRTLSPARVASRLGGGVAGAFRESVPARTEESHRAGTDSRNTPALALIEAGGPHAWRQGRARAGVHSSPETNLTRGRRRVRLRCDPAASSRQT